LTTFSSLSKVPVVVVRLYGDLNFLDKFSKNTGTGHTPGLQNNTIFWIKGNAIIFSGLLVQQFMRSYGATCLKIIGKFVAAHATSIWPFLSPNYGPL